MANTTFNGEIIVFDDDANPQSGPESAHKTFLSVQHNSDSSLQNVSGSRTGAIITLSSKASVLSLTRPSGPISPESRLQIPKQVGHPSGLKSSVCSFKNAMVSKPHNGGQMPHSMTLPKTALKQPSRKTTIASQHETIELDEDFADHDFILPEDCRHEIINLDEENEDFYNQIINPELNEDLGAHVRRHSTVHRVHDSSIRYPQVLVGEATIHETLRLRAGKTVELRGGSFLLITQILHNTLSDVITLRGFEILRMRKLNGHFDKKQNETCCMIEVEQGDPRQIVEQSVKEVNAMDVIKLRRLVVTNASYPEDTFRTFERNLYTMNIDSDGPLTLRFCFTTKYRSANDRRDVIEWAIEHIQEPHLKLLNKPHIRQQGDENRRTLWRGLTVLGGAGGIKPVPQFSINMQSRSERQSVIIDLNNKIQRPSTKRKMDSRVNGLGQPKCLSAIDLTNDSQNRSNSVQCLSTNASHVSSSPAQNLENVSSRSLSCSALQEDSPRSASSSQHFLGDINGADYGTLPDKGCISGSIKRSATPRVRIKGQKYTYGDAFAGAGGTTQGASMAGLEIVWGCDNNSHCAANWRTNFPYASMYEVDASELVQWADATMALKVDILHMSPPCQFFSPAHTTEGVDDEKNFAIIFVCGMILDAVKPRMGTLEQTFGIMHETFQPVFRTLVCMFTHRGYSVRWTIAPLQKWGLPQRRQRLILFFAGPGEPLPEFPAYTHSDEAGSGLKPLASCSQIIGKIPLDHPMHNPREAIVRNMPPWNGNSIAPRCITTSGGQNYHYSGLRDFTLAEFMVLQGFPLSHIFRGSYVKKQIGNAVPPIIAKIWFTAIRKALEEADGLEPVSEVTPVDAWKVINLENDDIYVDVRGSKRLKGVDSTKFGREASPIETWEVVNLVNDAIDPRTQKNVHGMASKVIDLDGKHTVEAEDDDVIMLG